MSAENESIFKVHEFVAHSTEINCLSFGPKSHKVLATGGNDCKVNVWQVGNSSNIWTLGQNKSPLECLCFDAQEQYVVSGAANGSIKVFDLNEGRLARNLGGHQVNTCSIQYHPYGEFIVSGSIDCSMKVWDVRNKSCIQTYSGHKKEVTCVRFSPDGRWIASSGKDNKLLIWDLVAGKLLNTLRLDPAYVTSFEFNPVEFIIGAVTSTRNVRLWDLDNMEPLSSTPPDTSAVRSMAFSADGSSIYSATKDSFKVYSWEPSAKLKASAEIIWDKVAELRVSSDGTKITAGSFNSNFVSVWNVDVEKVLSSSGVSGSKQRQSIPPQKNLSKSKAVPLDNNNGRYRDVDRENSSSPANNNSDNYDYQADSKSFENISLSPSTNNPSGGQSSAAKEEVTPVMQWASDEARDDMASSMSASFQKKMLEIQKQQQVSLRSRDPNYVAPHNGSESGGDRDQESDIKSCDKKNNDAKGIMNAPSSSIEQLQGLLPPSRYSPTPQSQSLSGPSDSDMGQGHGQRRGSSSSTGVAYERERDKDRDPSSILPSPSGQGQGPSDYHVPRRNSSSSGSGAALPTYAPAPAGLKSNVPLKGIARCTPADPRDRPSSLDPKERQRDTRDSRDYLSYADIDGSTESGTEVRGSSSGGRKNISSIAAVEVVDGKNNIGDLRAAAKRAAIAAADRNIPVPVSSVAQSGSQSSSSPYRSEERSSHGNREESYRSADPRSSSESDRRGESEADSLIDKMIRSSGSEAAAMSQRLSSLKILKRLWVRGDLNDVIEHMESLTHGAVHDTSQLVLLSDLLLSVELKGGQFSLQSCVGFMALLDVMISDGERLKMPSVVCAVLKSLHELLGGFGDLIRSSKAMQMAGGGAGVDLNREERLRKCNLCYNIIVKLKGKLDRIRQIHRTNYKLIDYLDRVIPLMDAVISY